jgi:hypothetical protein
MASKISEERSIKYITCLVKILPPNVTEWSEFIKIIGINCFPLEMLPIEVDEDGIIMTDEDDCIIISEKDTTLQVVEFKSVDTNMGKKFNVIFKIPIPSEDEEYYDYIMENIVNPLKYEGNKLAELAWTQNRKRHFIKLSLVVPPTKKGHPSAPTVPDQSRFRKSA